MTRYPEPAGRRWARRLIQGAAVAGLLVGAMATGRPVAASAVAATDEGHAVLLARGRSAFRVYCASCHGVAAKGDGKLAESLRVRPADLTQFAKRAGGVFPADQVTGRIDGREEVEGHGTSDMPVWGLSFQNPESDQDQQAEVKAKLKALVVFLETLQAK